MNREGGREGGRRKTPSSTVHVYIRTHIRTVWLTHHGMKWHVVDTTFLGKSIVIQYTHNTVH